MGWLYSTSLFYLNGLVFILILLSPSLYAQKRDSIQKPIKYHISVIEGVSKSRINQAFKNTITLNRLITRALDENDNRLSLFLQILIPSIGIGISHEEGHRSVLTELNIGSISQPFSFDKGLLYVKGVSDETLINLRRNNLPDYVHLHTAGLESDYMSILELENFITFELDDLNHLKYDYFTRKISHLFYFLTTITPFLFSDFEEEQNELERDIVGHDILGAIRHLHRPTENFYRYTFFDDLTNDEKKYARKTVLYSLLNLINPMLFGKKHFTLSTNSTINFSLGYSLAPFGGHFDQNFWIKKEKLNLFLYTRQFHKKIDVLKKEPVRNPPAKLYQYTYKNQTVYFFPQYCCDLPSELYDENCALLCLPDGGITGQGDGKCTDFFLERTLEKLIWEDVRREQS